MADEDLQQQLDAEYDRLVGVYNQEYARYERLYAERERAQDDMERSIRLVDSLDGLVDHRFEPNTNKTNVEQVVAENVGRTIDDLSQSFRILQISSTNSKALTADIEKYNVYYGLYNKLRQVSLGYIVGLDSNLWKSDVPRQTVEKMYLANTDYWLAYPTMAVMLWANNEQSACERAVSKAMQLNERKSALYFLLASLRFNRIEAAKEWYDVYFKIVDSEGVGDEVIYILQALLCGALGEDYDFAEKVIQKMRSLISDANTKPETKALIEKSLDGYFNETISVTKREFIDLKHICLEYDEMMELLSNAEKNEILIKKFKEIVNDETILSDRLSERIEDALYSLISAFDDAEQKLKDKIAYEEAVAKANGRLDIAKSSYEQMLEARKHNSNMALIMLNAALNDGDGRSDGHVRKFCLNSYKDDCIKAAQRYSRYRQKEKAEYNFNIDGCAMVGDENSFETNKAKLLNHYENQIKNSIKNDDAVKSCKKLGAISLAGTLLFLALTVIGFIFWQEKIGAAISFLVFTLIGLGLFVASIFMKKDQAAQVRSTYDYRIKNGVLMLERGLKQLAEWRKVYKEEDASFEKLISMMKEEI